MARGNEGVIWDWGADHWTWSPDKGRWTPRHKRPKKAVGVEVSTEALPHKDRYDFWCDTALYGFTPDPRRAGGEGGFSAQAGGIVSAGAEFFRFRSDAISGSRTVRDRDADGYEDITIGLVLTGQRRHMGAGDVRSLAKAGDIYVYDPSRPARVEWSAHKGVHLTLRRKAVESALGGNPPPPELIARALSGLELGSMMRSQMVMLGRHMDRLAAEDRSFLLDQAAQIGLYALSRIGGEVPIRFDPDSLFAAARRMIARQLSDPELDAASLAGALGCSRATLYRAFAAQQQTVAGLVREMRLEQACRLLVSGGPDAATERVAALCGFSSARSFIRTFRERYGITPQEARRYGGIVAD